MRVRHAAIPVIVVLLMASGHAQSAGVIGGGVATLPDRGAAPQRPGTPARDRRPASQPAGTATISGRVVSSEGAPLRRTQVQLAGAGVTGRSVATDLDGRYVFTALPAGRYSVRVFRSGYISITYGQRAPTDPSRSVELADGQALSGIDLVMPRGGAITGRIVDEFGEPVVQAQVQALRYQYQPSGERLLQSGGSVAATDDLGQFRLYGLTPGEYVVTATSRNQFPGIERFTNAVGLAPGGQANEGYAPTYFPGTANPGEAQPMLVGLGQDVSVQLQLVPARLSQVSGTVADSQGRPVAAASVMLRPSTSVGAGANRPANTTADGVFTIANVPPGDYLLDVRLRPQAQNAAPRGSRPGGNAAAVDPEFASMPLTVAGDISGLHVVTGKGATVAGRVVFEGMPPAEGLRIRVVAQPADPLRSVGVPGPRNAQEEGLVGPDGSFELTRISGPIFLRVQLTDAQGGPGPTQMVRYMTKSVIVDGVDVADTPFDPTRGGRVPNVTLVLTDKVTEIGGTVTDSRGTLLESAAVLIVPDSLPAGVSAARFQRLLQSTADGKFAVRGMPPGRYVAVAAISIDAAHQYDPDTAQRARQRGRSFSVREGETVTLDLDLTTDF